VKLQELAKVIDKLLERSLAVADPRAPDVREAVQDGLPGTIYIVDDDRLVREGIRAVLEDDGRKVEAFASAEIFLEGYSASQGDCLLIDAYLPGMSGLELLHRLTAGLSAVAERPRGAQESAPDLSAKDRRRARALYMRAGNAQRAKKPKHHEDEHDRSEYAAESGTAVTAVRIIAAAAAENQKQDDDNKDCTHSGAFQFMSSVSTALARSIISSGRRAPRP
jgi:DNA-binding NarL/FixJ family response regulator